MEHKVEVIKSHVFTSQDINDLICTALECGINYWCDDAEIVRYDCQTADLEEGVIYPKDACVGVSMEDQTNVRYASDAIGYGGKLTLTDAENEDESWELDLLNMLKGIKMYCEEYDESLSELIDNHDADIADLIVQFALFNEIVYG